MYDEIPDDDTYLMGDGDFDNLGGGAESLLVQEILDDLRGSQTSSSSMGSGSNHLETNGLTDRQEIVLSLIFVFSGLLSIMGSLTIIYKVLFKNLLRPITVDGRTFGNDGSYLRPSRSAAAATAGSGKQSSSSSTKDLASSFMNRLSQITLPETPYDRIMLGLSMSDIIASSTFVLTPFLPPKHNYNTTPGYDIPVSSSRVWAIGNESTCSFLGFLYQLSFAAVWYNCSLSYYYLATIRFGIKKPIFAKRYEIWLHMIAVSFAVGTASVGAGLGFYSEVDTGIGCWVNEWPKNCVLTGDCMSVTIGWIYGGIPVFVTLISLFVNNLIIYFFVRREFKRKNNGTATLNGEDEISAEFSVAEERVKQNELRRSQAATQGLLYVLSFIVSYTPAIILRIIESYSSTTPEESPLYPIFIFNSLLFPLQGFFNMFVYDRLTYLKFRNYYPYKSYWWCFQMACFHDASQLVDLDTSRYFVSSASRRHSGRSATRKYQQGRANYVLASSSGKDFSSSLDPVLERNGDSQLRSSSSSSEEDDANIGEGRGAAGFEASLVNAAVDLTSNNTTSSTTEGTEVNVVTQEQPKTAASTATALCIEDQTLQMELDVETNDDASVS